MRGGRSSPRVAHFFRRIGARGWRGTDYFTFSIRSPALRAWIAARLAKRRGRLLSIGCGSGELECHLARLGHDIVGLDFSHEMLRRARARGLEWPVQAHSYSLPFRSGGFKAVLLLESIGYLRLGKAFREAARVLAKDGLLLITSYAGEVEEHETYRKFRTGEITRALTKAGLGTKEQRFLAIKRDAVVEMPSEAGSSLLLLACRRSR